jgi:AcrR family transcriptional regulator
MSAAMRVIASQGLGAATATIAKEAASLTVHSFIYFETKAELLNQLDIELKTEMAVVALEDLPAESDVRAQLLHMWRRWLRWAVSCPEKRRTLAHPGVSDNITSETQRTAHQSMVGIAALLEWSRENGPLRNAPLGFVSALMSAMADTTIDFMINDPANAETHCIAAFNAMWRMLTYFFLPFSD